MRMLEETDAVKAKVAKHKDKSDKRKEMIILYQKREEGLESRLKEMGVKSSDVHLAAKEEISKVRSKPHHKSLTLVLTPALTLLHWCEGERTRRKGCI